MQRNMEVRVEWDARHITLLISALRLHCMHKIADDVNDLT